MKTAFAEPFSAWRSRGGHAWCQGQDLCACFRVENQYTPQEQGPQGPGSSVNTGAAPAVSGCYRTSLALVDVKGQCIPVLVIFTQRAKISWHALLATGRI